MTAGNPRFSSYDRDVALLGRISYYNLLRLQSARNRIGVRDSHGSPTQEQLLQHLDYESTCSPVREVGGTITLVIRSPDFQDHQRLIPAWSSISPEGIADNLGG